MSARTLANMKRASALASDVPAVAVARAATTIAIILSDAEIERIAAAVAERLAKALAETGPAVMPARDRLTVAEAAEILHCSRHQVRRLVREERLRATKIASGGSSRLLITRRSIDALLVEGT